MHSSGANADAFVAHPLREISFPHNGPSTSFFSGTVNQQVFRNFSDSNHFLLVACPAAKLHMQALCTVSEMLV